MRNVLIHSVSVSKRDVKHVGYKSQHPTLFDVTSSNYILLRFHNVQNKFIDVSTECVFFILKDYAEKMGNRKMSNM